MNSTIDIQYKKLLETILEFGSDKEDRTGTGTRSIFGYTIRHNMANGFPLLTTKRMPIKTIATELRWFLKGDTNIKYLVDNNCNIWNGDAYKKYKEAIAKVGLFDHMLDQKEFINKIKTNPDFAIQWGELGPIYGKQWREWSPVAGEINKGGKDQIKELIKNIKDNPDSRRLMVNAWNVGELSEMTLPPCHYGFQCYVRDGKYLSLMWNQRSVDTFLGLPFNIASYAILLCLIAQETNLIPDELVGNLGDVHLYNNHIEQAKTLLSRKDFKLPTMKFDNVNLLEGEFDFELIDYKYNPSIKAPLSN
jgi:thymidylate synthase